MRSLADTVASKTIAVLSFLGPNPRITVETASTLSAKDFEQTLNEYKLLLTAIVANINSSDVSRSAVLGHLADALRVFIDKGDHKKKKKYTGKPRSIRVITWLSMLVALCSGDADFLNEFILVDEDYDEGFFVFSVIDGFTYVFNSSAVSVSHLFDSTIRTTWKII